MANNEPQNESFMMKLATFIVDKRNLFFLLVVISVIFTMFSRNWVEVENDMAFYLPPESETRQGLDVMEDQFTTFGTARVMVANVTLDTARTLETQLSKLEGDFSASPFVAETVGVDNVCERSAAARGAELLMRKRAEKGMTAALAVKKWRCEF